MPKFNVPNSWDDNDSAIKFKKIQGNLNSEIKPNPKKKKKRNKKSKNAVNSKKDASPEDIEMEISKPVTNKIQGGRIEKKYSVKSQKKMLKGSLDAKKLELIKTQLGEQSATSVMQPSSSLQFKLKQELLGGRFRFINEQLYTMNSRKAEKLFQEDKDAFPAYHEGYRHQVQKWPMNPLDRIIKMVRRLPKSLEVGDFGCGEGRLAKEVPHKVYSMDLVSCSEDIIACDMANTPLQSGSLDVAVFCLSLMGTNLKDYILEANRVLKLHGFVYITEIQSRFENVRDFVRLLEACGFEMIKKDVAANFFYFFQFKKMRNVGKVARIPDFTLKPCLYRKR